MDIVEENDYESDAAREKVAGHLEGFKTEDMDTVILGCTHFPLLAPFIQKALGKEVALIDSGALTSFEVENVLKASKLENTENNRTIRIYTTGPEERFRSIAEKWLQTEPLDVKHVSIERLN
ncbi:MAG: hypothetical protein U5K84_05645 [Alkalibacterium sp.]|nr:hypothetical protein [Alkalibacterium sp.]